jgi:cell division protein FtsB
MFQAYGAMKTGISRLALGAALAAVVTYALVTLNGPHGIRALMERQRLIHEMQRQNAIDAAKIERIKEHIKRLDDNPSEQELEIRERLKLVHPDEKVFITGPSR